MIRVGRAFWDPRPDVAVPRVSRRPRVVRDWGGVGVTLDEQWAGRRATPHAAGQGQGSGQGRERTHP